jgi:uncharacterized RDD family membrane protein YckC
VSPVLPKAERATEFQGHYAGPVTRLLAYALDLLIVSVVFTLGAAMVSLAVDIATPWELSISEESPFTLVLYLGFFGLYLGNSWVVFARTPAMSLLGLRICRADGSELDARHGFIRLLAFPLGFLTLGAGFLGIIFGKTHQALYDRIADTAVVYDWDAEATRLRALAHRRVEHHQRPKAPSA